MPRRAKTIQSQVFQEIQDDIKILLQKIFFKNEDLPFDSEVRLFPTSLILYSLGKYFGDLNQQLIKKSGYLLIGYISY